MTPKLQPPSASTSITADLLNSFFDRVLDAAPESAIDASNWRDAAERWQRLGLRPGDLVLLCLPNSKALLHEFFGVLMAQGVPALLTPATPAARLRDLARETGARAIAAFRLPAGDLGSGQIDTSGPLQIAMLPPTPQPAAHAGEVVLLTSGTSGFSSGCVFDLEALLRNGQRHADSIGQRPDDTVLVSLPLHFSFALVAQALSSFSRGNRMVIGGSPFNIAAYQKTLGDFQITISSLTPVLIHSILKSSAEFSPGLRVLSVGGDALAPESVARLLRLRAGKELYLTYGLTQAGPRVSTLAAHAEPPKRYASVGRPLAETTVFLQEIANNTDKQLHVSSDTVMKRRIGRIEGRSQNDLSHHRTVATGDVFELDDEGYLYFKGRLGDFISRNGEKISLAAVRRVVLQLPHILQAKTHVLRNPGETEDFDLELRLDPAAADLQLNHVKLLRGLLRQAEMPRDIRVNFLNGQSVANYK